MTMSEVTAAQVLAAVREYVNHDEGPFELVYGTIREIARIAEVDTDLAGSLYLRRIAERKFEGQVKRAFGKLAETGELRKTGAGQQGPDGTWISRNAVRYYTLAGWDAAAARASAARAARDELDAAWLAVRSRLLAIGISSGQGTGGTPELDLDSWNWLVSLAEGKEPEQ